MPKTPAIFKFDTACAISQGGRDYQEDAIASDFSNGADVGFVVLSDGMGGHAAGDVASKIVVTKVFSELMLQRVKISENPEILPNVLQNAALSANACLTSYVASHPETAGMGATLVACTVVGNQLYWVSVGDSPLFLYRDNSLIQLNEDHSLGPHIDFMVQSGMLTSEEGSSHPERNVLTSVLAGQSDVAQVDCPAKPAHLLAGDALIVASDGLQYLTNEAIVHILRERPFACSSDIADALIDELNALGDPELDNISLSLIQIKLAEQLVASDVDTTVRDRVLRWPLAAREPARRCCNEDAAIKARARIVIPLEGSRNGA